MPEGVTLDLDQEKVKAERAAESALGEVLDSALTGVEEVNPDQPATEFLTRFFDQQMNVVIARVLRFPERVLELWGQYCQVGWTGQAAQVHAEREPFWNNVEGKLRLVQQARRMAEVHSVLTGKPLVERVVLRDVEEKLQQFKADLFDRWHTLDDLEDLLAATFPLTGAKLEAVGKKCPPEPAWYSEDGKPF